VTQLTINSLQQHQNLCQPDEIRNVQLSCEVLKLVIKDIKKQINEKHNKWTVINLNTCYYITITTYYKPRCTHPCHKHLWDKHVWQSEKVTVNSTITQLLAFPHKHFFYEPINRPDKNYKKCVGIWHEIKMFYLVNMSKSKISGRLDSFERSLLNIYFFLPHPLQFS
jgi:hypothetical protein